MLFSLITVHYHITEGKIQIYFKILQIYFWPNIWILFIPRGKYTLLRKQDISYYKAISHNVGCVHRNRVIYGNFVDEVSLTFLPKWRNVNKNKRLHFPYLRLWFVFPTKYFLFVSLIYFHVISTTAQMWPQRSALWCQRLLLRFLNTWEFH